MLPLLIVHLNLWSQASIVSTLAWCTLGRRGFCLHFWALADFQKSIVADFEFR
jgi:hypothetical protein